MKIVCLGDSITMSGLGGWTDWLQTQLGESHVVINSGIGANTTMLALDRFAVDVAAHEPDIVLIEFGINDAYVFIHQSIPRHSLGEYERNMRELIRLTQELGALPVLVVNHVPATDGLVHVQGNGRSIESNLEPYSATVTRLAAELDLPVIDFPSVLTAQENAAMLDEDGIHLSAAGQQQYGHVVLDGLLPVIDTLRSLVR